MTLTQIEYIIALDRYKSFAKAAEKCFVTQPTLSTQVQKIESHFNIKIFDRTRKPVATTVMGQKVIRQAKVILRESKRIEEIVLDAKDQIYGNFHLGVIPSVAGSLVPLFLSTFVKLYPAINLTIEELQTDVLIEKILNEEVDAGIAATPLVENMLEKKKLYSEEFFVYLNPSSSLLNKKRINKDDLKDQNILLLGDGHCFKTQALAVCGLSSVKKNYNFESSSFNTLIDLVDKNMGVTLLPYFVKENLKLKSQRSRIRRFSGETPVREISLISHKRVLKESITRALEEVISTKI